MLHRGKRELEILRKGPGKMKKGENEGTDIFGAYHVSRARVRPNRKFKERGESLNKRSEIKPVAGIRGDGRTRPAI